MSYPAFTTLLVGLFPDREHRERSSEREMVAASWSPTSGVSSSTVGAHRLGQKMESTVAA
jgi:hypothetical protein